MRSHTGKRLTDKTAPNAVATRRTTVRSVLVRLVLSCLLPGIIGASALFMYEYRQGRAQVEREKIQTARAMVQVVDNHILRVQALAQGLAASDSLSSRNLALFYLHARAALEETRLGTSVVLTDANGRQLLNTSVEFDAPLPMHGNPEVVRRVFKTGETVISDIFIGAVLNRPLMAVAVPVRRGGKTIYLLNINVTLDTFGEFLNSQRLPTGWVATIFDSKGTIAARSRAADRFVGQKPAESYSQKLMSSSEGTFEAVMKDGVAVRAAYSTSPLTKWRVAIAMHQDAITAQFNQTVALLAAGIASLFAVALALAWRISGKLARAYQALIEPAMALGAGNRVTFSPVGIKEADEVVNAMDEASRLLEKRSEELNNAIVTLAESEERYRSLFSNMSEAFALGEPVFDEQGRPVDLTVLKVNAAFFRQTGLPAGIEGQRIKKSLPNLDQFWIDRHAAVAMSGVPDTFEHVNADTGRCFQAHVFSPSPGRFASLFFDITDQKHLVAALQASERRLALALMAGGTAVWEMDVASEKLVRTDDALYTMLGYAPGELKTASEWISLVHDEDRVGVPEMINAVIDGSEDIYRRELRVRARDGTWRWILSQAIAAERDDEGHATRLVGTHTDITERKLAQEHVRKAALHDPLTGLPNRALVFEYGNHLLAAARRNHGHGALLFIDLDRFKPINDLYGHEAGDRVLKEVGRRLAQCTRSEDLVGRLGGDEFVVILPHLEAGRHRAAAVAQHLVKSISEPFRFDGLEMSVSPSIGISFYPEHASDIDTLIHAADMAMYMAKDAGRANYQFYSPELDRKADESLVVETRLKKALRNGGLRLHYQPVVDIASGRIIGAEALVRLVDDDRNPLGPDRFIPIAEASGLIGDLGEWVVAEACRQHKAWLREGLQVSIAINVSPLQFRQRDFAEKLSGVISKAGVDPACFQVEVTESAVMESLDEAIEILNRIKALGVKVSLDDFGTGYSSLSRLSTLPLDKLKVDQSFVRQVGSDQASRAVTEAIIALGRSLNLEVIGEGIESEDVLRYLREHGCDQAQGFWYSHPLPASEFARWCRKKQECVPNA